MYSAEPVLISDAQPTAIQSPPTIQYPQFVHKDPTNVRLIELGRAQWPNYDDQHYLKGCKWSPDGTCLLAVVRGAGTRVFELSTDLYEGESIVESRATQALVPAIGIPEMGLVYDFCWYPGMNSGNPATCCWAASSHEGPIHLWDAFTGELRCSYRGFNVVDELEAALSVEFSADGQSVFCGYKKNVKIFATGRPGRQYAEYPVTHAASCIAASMAQPGVVAIGTWKNTIELVSQSDGTFRHLHQLLGHRGGITTMQFSNCGTRLYSGARKDKELICWDLRVPGRPLFIVNRESNTNQRIWLDVSRSGEYLVSGGTDGKVQIWNVKENGQPQPPLQLPLSNDCVNGVSLHPLRPILATSSGQHHAQDPLHHSRFIQATDNSVSMWWLGLADPDPDLITAVLQQSAVPK